MTEAAYFALNRFGIGARPGEAAQISDAKGFLAEQLERFDAGPAAYAISHSPADFAAYMAEFHRRSPWTGQMSAEVPDWQANNAWNIGNQLLDQAVRRRFEAALATPHGFPERLMWFWSNHFACNSPGHMAGHEFHLIRGAMNGFFADMVLASCRSPAMLDYLNQWNSFGMNSPHGGGRRGMNENLGRELLELHTLGVTGGYTQQDVIEVSKALTGWTFNGWMRPLSPRPGTRLGGFIFDERMHEPGARTVLGKTYPEAGADQLRAIVRDLCRTRQCAEFVCAKLVRHFFADDPPEWAVAALAQEWLDTGGWLPAIHLKLVDLFFDNLSRVRDTQKFRSVWEWSVALGRYLQGAGITSVPDIVFARANGFNLQGRAWTVPSPAGFSDVKEFITAEEMFWRMHRFQFLWSSFRPGPIPSDRLPLDFAFELGAETVAAIRSAGTQRHGLVYLLASPEFTWR